MDLNLQMVCEIDVVAYISWRLLNSGSRSISKPLHCTKWM